jgi:hypothetical protein
VSDDTWQQITDRVIAEQDLKPVSNEEILKAMNNFVTASQFRKYKINQIIVDREGAISLFVATGMSVRDATELVDSIPDAESE